MINTIIFDFFGVIHQDPQAGWLADNGLSREGAFAEASDLIDSGDIDYAEYVRRYSEASGIEPDKIIEGFSQYSLIPETLSMLQKFKQKNFKVALISNAGVDELEQLLQKHNLKQYFNTIVISGDIGICKPDPAIYHHALKLIDSSPSETVFIDDSQVNVNAAIDIGINGILFDEPDLVEARIDKLLAN
jgi:HAD superfamily hydrolase (TIGR01509 family)